MLDSLKCNPLILHIGIMRFHEALVFSDEPLALRFLSEPSALRFFCTPLALSFFARRPLLRGFGADLWLTPCDFIMYFLSLHHRHGETPSTPSSIGGSCAHSLTGRLGMCELVHTRSSLWLKALDADAAPNAMADASLKPADIDGIATAGETPVTVAPYLGLTPK